jgi:hypothetical protein
MIPLGILATTAGGGGGAGSYELISTAYGTGSSGVITFSSIPSTYKHLQIRVTGRSTRSGSTNTSAYMQLNGSASGYAYHRLYGDGSSVSSGAITSMTYAQIAVSTFPAADDTANVHAASVIDILDYASTTKNTTIREFIGANGSVIKQIGLYSALWNNTAAVTSITINDQFANWTTTSRFSLYGIKG